MILGECFKSKETAAQTAEEDTEPISWILNHQQVHAIFNEIQAEVSVPPGKALSYLVANLTRWISHLVAFVCLQKLKDSLHQAVISKCNAIIDTQVGAEKNQQKKQKLEDKALAQCDLIDDGDFWHQLAAVIEDLEPICLGLNMNQGDSMCPDQAVITFAGIFLHFQKHSNKTVTATMSKKIEKQWKAKDQSLFILVLVLNPFKNMSCFGNQASVTLFTLNTILLKVCTPFTYFSHVCLLVLLDILSCSFSPTQNTLL